MKMYFLSKTGDFLACHVSFQASLGKIFEGNVKLEKTQVLGGCEWIFQMQLGWVKRSKFTHYSYWRLLFIMGDIFFEDFFPFFYVFFIIGCI